MKDIEGFDLTIIEVNVRVEYINEKLTLIYFKNNNNLKNELKKSDWK